jgi:hypothetical protein
MVGSGVLSWSGYLPAILWTRPTHEGIHMHVWCPAGVDEHTFRRAGSRLAAACWASDVRVEKHPRWSQILVLVIATGRRGTTPPDLRAPGTGQ